MEELIENFARFIDNFVLPHFNYWAYVVIMMIGLWAVIAKRNLIKKLIGMSIFQTAIILFYVSLGVKDGATIPIKYAAESSHSEQAYGDADSKEKADKTDDDHSSGDHGSHKAYAKLKADDYNNPLPHVLMLTAIVVGVSTLGVALAVSQSVFKDFGTLEEHEILAQIKNGDSYD